MKVTIGKDDKKRRAVEVDNTVLLGKGGEKVVYADPSAPRSMAIAMYHQPSPQRAAKVRAFIDAPLKWPEHVIAPLEDVRDAKDQIVGFSMRQLNRRFVKFKNIFVPSWRRDHGVTTKVIAAKYLHVGDDLFNHIHKVGCVGDLNDGGLCLDEVNHAHAWVDVDSFKIGNSPCMVGQQLYLCPALYGIDLSTGNYFEPWHDGYSYCVLLFRSLLGQHPFKAGSHKAYADITDRARHGMTLMDKEVDRGNVKFYPDLLTDELMDAILQRLKLQDKTPFPLDRLQAYHDGLVACPSCKTEYPGSRKHCPACSTATTVNIKKIMGVELIELIAVSGHILHVQLDGNTIYCIAEEAGDLVVWIKDDQSAARRLKMGLKYRNGMRFAVFAGTVAVCSDDDPNLDNAELFLYDVKSVAAVRVAQTTTVVMAGKAPVFAGSQRFLYRLAGNMIMAEKRIGTTSVHLASRIVAEAFPRQCWFAVDPSPDANAETIFGINRDATKDMWFVVSGKPDGSKFSKFDVALPALERGESMSDVSVRFDAGTVLVARRTILRGVERTRLSTVSSKDGSVLTSEILDSTQHPLWDTIHGKAFAKGWVMHPSDAGIIPEQLANHKVQPALTDTGPVVSMNDSLFRYGSGILVVRHNKVVLVTKK